jgi:DNA-binding beta-propeller fold protein YncE
MSLVSERRGLGLFPTVSAVIALTLVALFALTVRAQAAETLFWDNYRGDPDTVAYANIDGTGGGSLNLSGTSDFEGPEGMAYDAVTNRLYVATTSSTSGHITYINLDGSGGGSFTAPGAPIEEPEGITLDPATRTVYWINTGPDTISWAKLDGSAGGVLNTSGADLGGAVRLAVDPVAGKLFWGANPPVGNSTIEYANVNNTGGGRLDISGATEPEFVSGTAVDPAAGRVYWLDETGERISFASLSGGGGGDVDSTVATFDEAYGLALDPSLGRLYWGNYGNEENRTGAIGFSGVNGGGGGIDITSAPLSSPQDPLIIKSPTGTGAPTLARDSKNRAALSCTQGTWAGDFAGGFVYQAPHTYAYQWALNGVPIGGATAATFAATSAGQYTCAVTATNPAGTSAQTSAAIDVKAAKIKLTTKKKAKAEAGDLVKFKVKAVNQGDLAAKKSAKLCVKLPKSAKDDLKAPKCKKAGLSGGVKKTFTIKVKVKGGADLGADKLTFKVKGAAGKAAKTKILVK